MKKILLSAAMLTAVLATAQNTGIGTTNPQAKLEVKGSGNTNGTKALRIIDNTGKENVTVLDDGRLFIGGTDTTVDTTSKFILNNGALRINGGWLHVNNATASSSAFAGVTAYSFNPANTKKGYPSFMGMPINGSNYYELDPNTNYIKANTNMLQIGGVDGRSFAENPESPFGHALIVFKSAQDFTANNKPTKIDFIITEPNKATTTSALLISENANIGIGTTTPTAKLQVAEGDVYIDQISRGVIMKSPDGTCYRYTPANGGALTGTAVTCP